MFCNDYAMISVSNFPKFSSLCLIIFTVLFLIVLFKLIQLVLSSLKVVNHYSFKIESYLFFAIAPALCHNILSLLSPKLRKILLGLLARGLVRNLYRLEASTVQLLRAQIRFLQAPWLLHFLMDFLQFFSLQIFRETRYQILHFGVFFGQHLM